MASVFVRRNASQSDQTARGFLLTVAHGQCWPAGGCHCVVARWAFGSVKAMFRRTSLVLAQAFFNTVWFHCGAPSLPHPVSQPAKARSISTKPVFRPFGLCTCHRSLLFGFEAATAFGSQWVRASRHPIVQISGVQGVPFSDEVVTTNRHLSSLMHSGTQMPV